MGDVTIPLLHQSTPVRSECPIHPTNTKCKDLGHGRHRVSHVLLQTLQSLTSPSWVTIDILLMTSGGRTENPRQYTSQAAR